MNLDTMTQVSFSGSTNLNSDSPGQFHASPAVGIFYPARLAPGFDVAYGPCEEVRLPLRPGSRAKLPDLEIEVIAIERFSTGEWSGSLANSRGAHETRASTFHLGPTREPRTTVLFSLSLPELSRFCDIVLVNRKGEEETISLGRVELLTHVFTKTLPEDLEEMILRYRPNQAGVVFELPPLRGVPEFNRDLDNLFDVTIPHLRANSGRDLERNVANQAGVRFNIGSVEFPEGYFPRHYENVTLHALLEEYLAHHPEGSRVRLDRRTHRLVIPEPFSLKKSWEKLLKWTGF